MTVSILIAGQTARKVVELPDGATVAQLKAKFTELSSGIIKSLTGGAVAALTDGDALTNGMLLSFAPTETRTTSTGVQVQTKKIAGANEEVSDDVTLTPVKIVRSQVFFDSTVPSVMTVGDALEAAGVTGACVFINNIEVGYATKIGNEAVTIEVRDCVSTPLFATTPTVDCDEDDCDEDSDMD